MGRLKTIALYVLLATAVVGSDAALYSRFHSDAVPLSAVAPTAPKPIVPEAPVVSRLPTEGAWFASGSKLPPGYKCAGGGGLVYRVDNTGGTTTIEPLRIGGQLAHCGGGFVYKAAEPLPAKARLLH